MTDMLAVLISKNMVFLFNLLYFLKLIVNSIKEWVSIKQLLSE